MASASAVPECSICLSPLTQQGMDVFNTSCQHQFHFQCLTKHVQSHSNECPLCRTPLQSLADILKGLSTTSPVVSVNDIVVQQTSSIQTVSEKPRSTTRSGLWPSLRASMTRAFSWLGNSTSSLSTRPGNASSRRSNANTYGHILMHEDRVNAAAVRALSERIQQVRQGSIEGQLKLPMITATTTLEFGAQESTKASNIYGMVTLKAPSLCSETVSDKAMDEIHIPIDLVCVVDQSGSMQGAKMTLLKDTLDYIMDQMGPLDRLAVISFDTSAFDRSNGLNLMTASKKQDVRLAIVNNIHASGGTHIGQGLEMALHFFQSRQTTNPLGAMLLLTDGQDNRKHDYSDIMGSLPDGVVCHTFGYGQYHDASLLSQLAERGHGGTFTYIDETNAIGPAFATALGSLFTCVAKQVRVNVQFDGEYQVTDCHTSYSFEPTALPSNRVMFKLTDLNADEGRNLVFQLNVPKVEPTNAATANDDTIGHVSLEYVDANSGHAVQTLPVPFKLARPDQLDPQSPLLQVNHDLDVQRNRAETSRVLREAARSQNYDQARTLIQVHLAKIRASVSAQDSLCQKLITDLENRYANQNEFNATITSLSMQHGQERATYASSKMCSANLYTTQGQERFKMNFASRK